MGFRISGLYNCDKCINTAAGNFDALDGPNAALMPKGWTVNGHSILCPIHAAPAVVRTFATPPNPATPGTGGAGK
jgi:hypothetical protein